MTADGRAPGPLPPIPFTVLTGFLGAGKTTLLNRMLRDPALADTVVIVNEFGEVGIDHLLVERVDGDVVLLAAGCLCCTVRGDLVSTLEDLLRRSDNGRMPPFRRVVVETTGLADPAPVLSAVLHHPYLSLRYGLEGVITVVDAGHGRETLGGHEEARRQVAVADRIVLSKTDHADPAGLKAVLRALNPSATILRAVSGAVPAADLLSGGLFTFDGKIGDVARWLRAGPEDEHGGHRHAHDVSRHGDRIRSTVLTSNTPMAEGTLDLFLDLLRSTFGPRILRLKGLVSLTCDPNRPVVIQGVRHTLHVPAQLDAWPDADRRTRLVLILEDVPPEAITRMWNAFTGRPTVDGPDAAALADNPLAPATLAR